MKKLFLAVLLASSVLGPALAADVAPAWLRVGPHSTYDGVTDDLVTGGLWAEAMLGAPPGYADPLHPTAAELRRAALFLHWRPTASTCSTGRQAPAKEAGRDAHFRADLDDPAREAFLRHRAIFVCGRRAVGDSRCVDRLWA